MTTEAPAGIIPMTGSEFNLSGLAVLFGGGSIVAAIGAALTTGAKKPISTGGIVSDFLVGLFLTGLLWFMIPDSFTNITSFFSNGAFLQQLGGGSVLDGSGMVSLGYPGIQIGPANF